MSLLHSNTSSTNISDISCKDSNFVSSSNPLNINSEPFGNVIVLSELFILQNSNNLKPFSASLNNANTVSLIVEPCLLHISTLRFDFNALSTIFCAIKCDLPAKNQHFHDRLLSYAYNQINTDKRHR